MLEQLGRSSRRTDKSKDDTTSVFPPVRTLRMFANQLMFFDKPYALVDINIARFIHDSPEQDPYINWLTGGSNQGITDCLPVPDRLDGARPGGP